MPGFAMGPAIDRIAVLDLTDATEGNAIGIGIRGCPGVSAENARIVRIRNTLEMTTVWASEPMLTEIGANPKLERLSEPFVCDFDRSGALQDVIDLQH